jgi:hypothetical protein
MCIDKNINNEREKLLCVTMLKQRLDARTDEQMNTLSIFNR